MDIKKLSKEIHKNAVEKGFWDDKENIAEKLMLIVSEISEALEADREDRWCNDERWIQFEKYNNSPDDLWKAIFEAYIKDTFQDELADAVIRILDLAENYDIDLMKHIEAKHKYNKLRPYLHGKKY